MSRTTTPRWPPASGTSNTEDFYRQFSDATRTPVLDVLVLLATLVLVAGGSLAVLLGIGYASSGDGGAAGYFVVFAVLVAVNVGVRVIRGRVARARRPD